MCQKIAGGIFWLTLYECTSWLLSDFLCGVMYTKYIVNYWSVFLYLSRHSNSKTKIIYFERGLVARGGFVVGGFCTHCTHCGANVNVRLCDYLSSQSRPGCVVVPYVPCENNYRRCQLSEVWQVLEIHIPGRSYSDGSSLSVMYQGSNESIDIIIMTGRRSVSNQLAVLSANSSANAAGFFVDYGPNITLITLTNPAVGFHGHF